MARVHLVQLDRKMTKKEELQFHISNLDPDIKGLERAKFITRFYWWYVKEGLLKL